MNGSESKFGQNGDVFSKLRNFADEINRSRQQAEMASRLIGELIQYHQYFCGETAKSFARLHEQLQEICPAECQDQVSLRIILFLVCRSLIAKLPNNRLPNNIAKSIFVIILLYRLTP